MTSLVPTSKERRKFKIDRDRAVKEFLENRLLNDTFMDNFRLDDLRAVGNKFYKGSRVEFQTIWDETLTLVNKLKSIEMIDYGKKWVHMIYKHSADNRQEILLFYVEALMLNRVIEQMKMSEDNKVNDMYGDKSIYDASLIYNAEYLDPPLNTEQFNTVWYEIERRIPYIKNHLTSCFCPEHKELKITKLYDFKAQKMIYKDFTDNDILRIELLYHLESLLEDNNNSVDQIRKSLLEYNEDVGDDKLSLDTLQCIWDVALDRASECTLKKLAIDIVSHGQNKCQHAGCREHDIDKLDFYTKDGRRIMDMTQEEYDKEFG
jgi:hypothetical protein